MIAIGCFVYRATRPNDDQAPAQVNLAGETNSTGDNGNRADLAPPEKPQEQAAARKALTPEFNPPIKPAQGTPDVESADAGAVETTDAAGAEATPGGANADIAPATPLPIPREAEPPVESVPTAPLATEAPARLAGTKGTAKLATIAEPVEEVAVHLHGLDEVNRHPALVLGLPAPGWR